MNKGLMNIIAIVLTAFLFTSVTAFATTACEPVIIIVPNDTDGELTITVDGDSYLALSRKTVFAYYTSDSASAMPADMTDIKVVETIDNAQAANYTIDFPADHKEYIVVRAGGMDGSGTAKTWNEVYFLGHSKCWGSEYIIDETGGGHKVVCEYDGCQLTPPTVSHIPVGADNDCTTGDGDCKLCTYKDGTGAAAHKYTDETDNSCDTIGCEQVRVKGEDTFTVTFNANGGTLTGEATKVTLANGKLTGSLPTAQRNGYQFKGWFTRGSNEVTVNSDVFYENAEIFAKWETYIDTYNPGSGGGSGGGGGAVEKKYTLSFNTNGGSTVSEVVGNKDAVIGLSKYTSTKNSYDFAGWCSDTALNNIITEVTLTRNTTIYAKWVSKNSNDNTDKQEQSSVAEGIFTDVSPADWYFEAVKYAYENDIMKGTSETEFDPADAATRGMIATILYRIEGEPQTSKESDFTDVPVDAYYTDAVAWANTNEIISGYGDGKFGAEDAISREQLVTLLYRYAMKKGYDVSFAENTDILKFDDAEDVSEYALSAMKWAYGAEIINGESGKLNPGENAERAQVAAILMRFCKLK